jgi:thioredoxin reductase (NADPH)
MDGLFMAIGNEPQTELFKGQLELDDKGYIITKNHIETSIEGVFAAGDVQNPKYQQAVIAAGSGATAAIAADLYLQEKGF